MKITKEVRKKYLVTKFKKDILPDLELTKAEKNKIEAALKKITVAAPMKNDL